jgi:hypothetical protein
MKWILPAALLLTACQNKPEAQRLAEEHVTAHIKKDMRNPDSYAVVKFGSLNEYTYARVVARAIDVEETMLRITKNAGSSKESIADKEARIDSLKNLLGTPADSVVVEYSIIHKYKGTNAYGGIVQQSKGFTLDTTFKVTDEFEY